MVKSFHNRRKRETMVVMETRDDCLIIINDLVELMNHANGKPVKLRIKTED